ncbi:MAG: DUF5668 domain-containing protein [Spirosomataceae bacterium]
MNSKNLIPGLILVALGVLFLADNYDIFEVSWHSVFRLWPLLLIVLGVNALLGKRSPAATGITIVLLCIAIPAAIISNVTDDWRHHGRHWSWDHDNDDDEDDYKNESRDDSDDDEDISTSEIHQSFNEPSDASIKTASFYMNGGAAKFVIGSTSSNLADAKADLNFGKGYDFTKVVNGNNAELKLKWKEGDHHINIDDKNENDQNKVSVQLNNNVEWDLDIEIGAGTADFDLSQNIIKSLKLKTGVTDSEIKLGDKAAETTVKVESGVAQVELQIPSSVGCRIRVDGALNGKDFEGFIKNGDTYESPNYSTAAKKINVEFDGGLSNLKVKKY